MHIDFEADALLALFDEYKSSYSQMEVSVDRQALVPRYGTAGNIPRGYYCPSLVIDIVIGGTKRGKISGKALSADTAAYVFYFDGEDKLITVEAYSKFPGTGRVVTSREYLLYDGLTVIAPEFSVGRFQKEPFLRRITKCEYDGSGRIRKYRTLFSSDLESGLDHIDSYRIYAEEYKFDPKSALLDTVIYGQANAFPAGAAGGRFSAMLSDDREQIQLKREFSCHFIHDENGFITQYKEADLNGDDSPEVIRTIPKNKRKRK